MGLPATKEQVWTILNQENFNQERAIDRILNGQLPPIQPVTQGGQTQKGIQPATQLKDSMEGYSKEEQKFFQQAVHASINHEPLDIIQRFRDENDTNPVGLKNVGNTCYFNSLLQNLFMLPNVSSKILSAKIPVAKPQLPGTRLDSKEKRRVASQALIVQIKSLYANMLLTN